MSVSYPREIITYLLRVCDLRSALMAWQGPPSKTDRTPPPSLPLPPIVSLRAGRRRLAALSRSNTLAYLDFKYLHG